MQVLIHLPVTTALGLDNEPGWLPGYGWISAPQCRQWLVSAELRQVCVGPDGFVLDSANRVVRPVPTPQGVREEVLAMVSDPGQITEKTWRTEPRHDPSDALTSFIDLRDPYPAGPTAAWNLRARADRTHQLKHSGWTPLRTATATLWCSPAGQLIEVPHHTGPPPDLDTEAHLPDPDKVAEIDAELLRIPGPDDEPPWDTPPPF